MTAADLIGTLSNEIAAIEKLIEQTQARESALFERYLYMFQDTAEKRGLELEHGRCRVAMAKLDRELKLRYEKLYRLLVGPEEST